MTEFVVFFEQFGNFVLVGVLIDFVSAVELLDVVDQPQQTIDLFLVLETSFFVAGQVHGLLHYIQSLTNSNTKIQITTHRPKLQ